MFLQAQNAPKSVFSRGCSAPRTPLGKLTTLPSPQTTMLGWRHPLPIPLSFTGTTGGHLHTFGVFNMSIRHFTNTKFVVTMQVSSVKLKMHQTPFSAGDPAGGAYDAPPDPLVGWGRGHPSPFPSPSTPFGVSISARTAPRAPHFFGQVYAPGYRGHIG